MSRYVSLANIIHNKTLRQTTSLFGSGLFLTMLTIITTPIITRTLGPVDFSIMKLFLTITNFVILFFNFGFSFTVGVMLAALTSREEQRRLIGTSLVISLIIGLGYALFLLHFSYYADRVFDTIIGKFLRLVLPFFIFYPVNNLVQQIGKGTNRIDSMVYGRSIPYIIRAVVIVILWIFGALSLVSLVYVEAILSIVPVFVLLRIFRPSLSGFISAAKSIYRKNRTVGFNIYLANVTAQSTYQLDGIMIPIFADTVQLGYYYLANVFAETMNSFSMALSSSKYRDFAQSSGISKRVLFFNHSILVLGSFGTIVFGKLIIRIVAGADFDVPFGLILPVGILGFVHGAYQPYFNFLNAKGQGIWIRNIGFITTGMNIAGNVLLIPFWGAIGAAWASVLSRGTGYIAYLYYYRREIGKKE